MSSYIRLQNLSKYPHIAHAISTKETGSMKKEDGSIHHANLIKFSKIAHIGSPIICMEQVHGNNVTVVENTRELVIAQTDGLITNKKNIALAVITADCLPILFYDPIQSVIGVCHAGSKGLLRRIIHNTVAKMQEIYGCNPSDLQVGIGPYVRTKCYEVGEDFAKQFQDEFSSSEDIVTIEGKDYFLSLKNVALQCLIKEGILKTHITVSEHCTKCEDALFYSYRRGEQNGRFVSVIRLV